MGVSSSREAEHELSFLLRRQSIRSTNKLQKLIEYGFLSGHLREIEYHCSIGLYYGMKTRYLSTMDPVFLRCMDDLYDQVTTRIQERMSEVKALQSPPPSQPPRLSTIIEEPQISSPSGPYNVLREQPLFKKNN